MFIHHLNNNKKKLPPPPSEEQAPRSSFPKQYPPLQKNKSLDLHFQYNMPPPQEIDYKRLYASRSLGIYEESSEFFGKWGLQWHGLFYFPVPGSGKSSLDSHFGSSFCRNQMITASAEDELVEVEDNFDDLPELEDA